MLFHQKSKFVMKIFFKPIMTSALLSDDQELPTLDSFWYMTSHMSFQINVIRLCFGGLNMLLNCNILPQDYHNILAITLNLFIVS